MMNRAMAWALALTVLPLAVGAQQPDGDDPRTVTVNAMASVEREPDRAVLMLAVESQAQSAQQAAQTNAELMTRVLGAVRDAGIPDRQIRTVNYDLQPVYAQHDPREPRPMEPQEPRIVGYRAINMVRVEVDGVSRVGGVIDAALAAGANRVDGIHFALQDQDAAFAEALRAAVAKARSQAEAVAQAAGQQLGQPLNIQVGGGMPMPPMPMYRGVAMDMQAASTPVQGGVLDVSASVTIVYELVGG
jgi:uncharacterized protein